MDAWLIGLNGGWLFGAVPLALGWILDRLLGDPKWLPHPVIGFGKAISHLEKAFNKGGHRFLKGAIVSIVLTLGTFLLAWYALYVFNPYPLEKIILETIGVFYCLAGTTLAKEVREVFKACEEGIEAARRQVGRIVGRDTATLDEQEVKTAALETLAENLSDGVIAPLFWYMIAGLPGMMAYKMINTQDSMIGYRNERYRDFGCVAARIDDIANFIPARLTALLMIIAAGRPNLMRFVSRFGRSHASPNSGYPEAALAGILGCRFGGTHDYFGVAVYKPYIGEQEKVLEYQDMESSIHIAVRTEVVMLILTMTVSVI